MGLKVTRRRATGLTAREHEVAALVAYGKTNKEIAHAMTVDVKTVEKHVGNVLGKLGCKNRTQIAAWAMYGGLVVPPGDLDDPHRYR